MQSQGRELAALDFADIIGGPLIAVINAQAKSAHVTSSFIQTMAFEPSQGTTVSTKLKTVDFDFAQVLGDTSKLSGIQGATTIKVPLITMLPIPYIRVDSMTIDLNVTLHDVQHTTLSNDFTFGSTMTAGESAGFLWSESTSFTTSVTERNTYQNDSTIDDTYSLHVTVHAVQDQMPGGMSQILNIFANAIQSQAGLLQTIMTAQIQAKTQQVQQALSK
jgi:hypothetical protein